MKLLIDANMSARWVAWLEQAGLAAVHWTSVGPGDSPDLTIMQFARENGYTILTLDLDFGIHLAGGHNEDPSVVQVRLRYHRSEEVKEYVISAIQNSTAELESGALLTISPKRLRIHLLPVA